MYPKRPIFSRMRSCLAVSLLLLTTMGAGLVRSAPPAQAPQTAAAVQQESIALQITSIADSAAGTQTSSFQSQLKAVQQQYGVTRDSEAPSDMAPLPEPDKVAEPAVPVVIRALPPLGAGRSAQAAAGAARSTGFSSIGRLITADNIPNATASHHTMS